MTQEQRERMAEAYDILVGIFADLRVQRGCAAEAKRLDTILGKLENLMYLKRG